MVGGEGGWDMAIHICWDTDIHVVYLVRWMRRVNFYFVSMDESGWDKNV
jgi:hypothetical protein